MGIKDVAKRIASAAGTQGGNFIKGGRGRLMIKKLAIENGYKGDRFVGEMTVVESFSNGVGTPPEKGASVSFVQVFAAGEAGDMAANNTKSFLVAANGDDLADFKGDMVELVEALCTKEQPLRGGLIDFECRDHKTKKEKMIIIPSFIPVKSQTEATIAAGRAALDAA